jgi:sugar lactone lactonase YvrE
MAFVFRLDRRGRLPMAPRTTANTRLVRAMGAGNIEGGCVDASGRFWISMASDPMEDQLE